MLQVDVAFAVTRTLERKLTAQLDTQTIQIRAAGFKLEATPLQPFRDFLEGVFETVVKVREGFAYLLSIICFKWCLRGIIFLWFDLKNKSHRLAECLRFHLWEQIRASNTSEYLSINEHNRVNELWMKHKTDISDLPWIHLGCSYRLLFLKVLKFKSPEMFEGFAGTWRKPGLNNLKAAAQHFDALLFFHTFVSVIICGCNWLIIKVVVIFISTD